VSEILLKADEARAASEKVKTVAASATSDFERLKGELSALATYFKGRTADAFDQRYQDWHESAVHLNDSLDGLGLFLRQAADTIERVDEELRSSLG
jgi:WXG100 family type VII secretion target